MAGQGLERREVLRIMALAAAASGQGGFSRWAFAHGHEARLQVRPARYTPRFCSSAEYATVERLADLILPSDGSPGAREAGVAEFIDFMVWSDPALQYPFRLGLAWLDAQVRARGGKAFVEMREAEQTALLQPLAATDGVGPGEEEGRRFFAKMRELTVMGFYTSRIGLQELDYPGLRLYAESPGCPHPDDPEHRRLSARD